MSQASILIGENINHRTVEPSYGQVLARGLSKDFKVYSAANFFKILNLAGDADIVFAVSPVDSGYAAYVAAKLRKKRFLLRVDDDYAWRSAIESGRTFLLAGDFQKFPKSGRVSALFKRQARVCDRAESVVVPSRFMSEIVHGWGVEPEKIKIIAEPVSFGLINTSKEEARKKIGIPGNILISVGPLVPWKGFRMLVKLMPQLAAINQFFRLVIVGDGPDYKILKPMIKNLGLDKKIYLMGSKKEEELVLLLAASDAFVLNSGHEVFPTEAIRAMAAGVPVITTAVGANPELIKQGENGFMIKYNDEFNLIEAIKTVWQTPTLRDRFIEEGKKKASQFSLEKTMKEIIKTINHKP